jgi:hypothetical protein
VASLLVGVGFDPSSEGLTVEPSVGTLPSTLPPSSPSTALLPPVLPQLAAKPARATMGAIQITIRFMTISGARAYRLATRYRLRKKSAMKYRSRGTVVLVRKWSWGVGG